MVEDQKLITWRKLHEITRPFCIRGEHLYLQTQFEARENDKAVDCYMKYSHWFKDPRFPSVVWLN